MEKLLVLNNAFSPQNELMDYYLEIKMISSSPNAETKNQWKNQSPSIFVEFPQDNRG